MHVIIYGPPWILFSCVLFFADFIFRGSLRPMKIKSMEKLTLENLYVYGRKHYSVVLFSHFCLQEKKHKKILASTIIREDLLV